MSALGFQSQTSEKDLLKGKNSLTAGSSSRLLDAMISDGKVTLTEFIGLMTGEVLGRNQYEEAQTVFAALCRSDGESRHDNLVTLGKLEAACREFGVRLRIIIRFDNILITHKNLVSLRIQQMLRLRTKIF